MLRSSKANALAVDRPLPCIEAEIMKETLGRALAVERLFSIRDQLSRAVSETAFGEAGFFAQA